MQRFYLLTVIFWTVGFLPKYAFSQSAENNNPVKMASSTGHLDGSTAKVSHSKIIVTAVNQRGTDNEINQLIDILPLFTLIKDSIIQPIDLSADYPGMTLSAWKVVCPNDSFTRGIKPAYGFISHHHGVGLLPTHTLILVDNPVNIRFRATKIWVDLNHNFDLTDDGGAQWYFPMKLTLLNLCLGS